MSAARDRQRMHANLAARESAEVAETCKLGEAARALLPQHPTAQAFLDALTQRKLEMDALRFLAHLLNKREAVWWGCLCAWHLDRAQAGDEVKAAFRAVVRWVRDPSEFNRHALQSAAEAAGDTNTPAGCLALAGFFSGGSLTGPDLPVVPPEPTLTADTVANALLLAAMQGPITQITQTFRQFLSLGWDVASGKNLWEGDARRAALPAR